MKLSEKYSPTQLAAVPWALYGQCANALGLILDNKFDKPHVNVYEHLRHTATEVFNHPAIPLEDGLPKLPSFEHLYEEESDVLGTLLAPESSRRLNIIGDVGVGKSTFLRHVMDTHLGHEPFMSSEPICLDWCDFTASVSDPVPEIHDFFVDQALAELERVFGLARLQALDDHIFHHARLFARDRVLLGRTAPDKHQQVIADAVAEVLKERPLEFVFERINALCGEDRNRLILLVDNIDHLHASVLEHLLYFLTQIQIRTIPLLIVAMRDHTFEKGQSAYRRDKAVPAWNSRLKPPNIKMMLERRIRYFLAPPADKDNKRAAPMAGKPPLTVRTGAGLLQIDRDMQSVCRALLNSPLSDPSTYDFLCHHANFNIREVFSNLQSILGCPGYAGFDKAFFLSASPTIKVDIDKCLVALGLNRHLMFFPDKSLLFNPYSAGNDAHSNDQVVGMRILQMLSSRTSPMQYSELHAHFRRWGYSAPAIEAQVSAMVRKDLLWTTTGAPSDFEYGSLIRLSYRGALYARKIVRRAVFNYMVSFDVEAPHEGHPIYRHHSSEFDVELGNLAQFDRQVDCASIADRVLGLADVMHAAEAREFHELTVKRHDHEFREYVAPRSISADIVDGLSLFLRSQFSDPEKNARYRPPSGVLMQEVAKVQAHYHKAFRDMVGRLQDGDGK